MEEQTSKMNPIRKFFLICSGTDLGILLKQECAIELNKYTGIGATIFSTALLASLSGGYALFTVFKSAPSQVAGVELTAADYVLPVGFGLVWGAIIFNLDRYIVSTIRKKTVPDGLSFKQLLHWKFGELARFVPRLLLAVFISIIITRPIELKLFESEIDKEMLRQTSDAVVEMQGKVGKEFPDIDRLTKENGNLRKEVEDRQTEVNKLYELALAEGAGEASDEAFTTRKRGLGPFYRQRWDKYKQAKGELDVLRTTNEAKVAGNEKTIADLRKQQEDAEQTRQPTVARNGLAARLKTLDDLAKQSRPIYLASWFLIFLFIMLETAPIIVKILSDRGPYDDIYETLEYRVSAAEEKKTFEIDIQLDTYIALSERLHGEILAAKLQVSGGMVDSLVTLVGAEIAEAQTDVARQIVAQLKRAQLGILRYQTAHSIPANNGHVPAPNSTTGARPSPPEAEVAPSPPEPVVPEIIPEPREAEGVA